VVSNRTYTCGRLLTLPVVANSMSGTSRSRISLCVLTSRTSARSTMCGLPDMTQINQSLVQAAQAFLPLRCPTPILSGTVATVRQGRTILLPILLARIVIECVAKIAQSKQRRSQRSGLTFAITEGSRRRGSIVESQVVACAGN
jgi:hypothetical protein